MIYYFIKHILGKKHLFTLTFFNVNLYTQNLLYSFNIGEIFLHCWCFALVDIFAGKYTNLNHDKENLTLQYQISEG
jgi:hypothetical protein